MRLRSNRTKYAIPTISSRGRYDLNNGAIKEGVRNAFSLYPKYKFDKIEKSKEIVIFVHGMRNTRYGAKMGTRALRRKLRELGYKYPVVSFSYDADIRGAHRPELYHKVLRTANKIAKQSGQFNLVRYIQHLKRNNPTIKIRLVGHSLGCSVIKEAVSGNVSAKVDSIYFFGSPVEWDDLLYMGYVGAAINIINYYNRNDEEIKRGVEKGELEQPSCLHRVSSNTGCVRSKQIRAKDHRFRSYIKKLRSFP